ncbi:hypothetical protein BDN70DRAFT_881212 [Pholiota conissans]|uniref:Pheromone n=1 Tax=Pholiota conissans TaxID=109636 RepID=A0A9P6CRU4_9AGAR|nr:hypothetical protein BDN70DRAFT_881212 [Pholiota conissans]
MDAFTSFSDLFALLNSDTTISLNERSDTRAEAELVELSPVPVDEERRSGVAITSFCVIS